MREYSRTTFRGKPTDYRTAVMAIEVEKQMGIKFVCWQGSYNTGGVGASAGTHDGGGALDLNVPGDADRITRRLRDIGFAAWHRTPPLFDEHIHCIDIGNDRLSPSARAQVVEYRSDGDGLSGAATDPQPYRPDPIRGFNFDKWQQAQNLIAKIGGIARRTKGLARRRRQARNQLGRLS